jgi:DNA-binding NarL/FixJ family response regulator
MIEKTPPRPVVLHAREKQIINLLLQGCENKDIAKELCITSRSVKYHFERLFLRFGVTNGIKRVKLAMICHRRQQQCPTFTETVPLP